MNDSYGDGWNGAYLEVKMNGNLVNNYDCNASYTLDSVYSFSGASMEFIFHSGSWDSEITFSILTPFGDTLYDGPAPSDLDYILHTSNSTCLPTNQCLSPGFLTANNITPTTADLGWVPGGNELAWNLEWGISGFVQGSGNSISNLTSSNSSLTGLSAGTSYDFYAQADCDSNGTSIWAGPYTFTTDYISGTCGSFTVELNDSFGDGWNGGYLDIEINGVVVYNITLVSGSGPESTNFPVDSGDVINVVYTAGDWPEENSYKVYDHQAQLLVDQQNSSGSGPLSTYALIACAQCASPISLNASNITTSSTNLSWLSIAVNPQFWNLEWGNSGFSIGSGNFIGNLNSSTYLLTNLNSFTTYDYYVQEVCGTNDLSAWSGPFSFTTMFVPGSCGAFTIALYDSFGDGWQGGYVDIDISGNVIPNITLQNGTGPEFFDFPVDSNDVVNIFYTPGAWPEENSYEVLDNNNVSVAFEAGSNSNGPNDTHALISCQSLSDVNYDYQQELNIYPNPTNGFVNIRGFKDPIETHIYDVTGKLLQTTSATTICLSSYAKGIYLLKVVSGHRVHKSNVVKD